ncbi:MAG: hypothetical protein DWQ37_12665 [Planctomycetota bacterium]|nr:MAG: hypothetical protein DWQ37_12665 [Planctomycetota bacterium]
MHAVLRAWWCLACLAAALGCAAVVEPQSTTKSPLAPLEVSPDSISLEVFSAPAPPSDPQLDELWKLVDEQSLPADLRRRLAENGMRAGIIGPNVPSALSETLKITDKRVDEEQLQNFNLDPDGSVKMRVLHAKAGKRVELAIGLPHNELTLLECTDGQVHGKTFQKAECRMALRAYPESDGEVRLELIPELHHGEYRSNIRGSGQEASFLWTQERPKRIFRHLALEPVLAPGQMLLICGRTDRTLSAGQHFFTDPGTGGKPVHMLWVLRAARAAPDGAFDEKRQAETLGPVTNDDLR